MGFSTARATTAEQIRERSSAHGRLTFHSGDTVDTVTGWFTVGKLGAEQVYQVADGDRVVVIPHTALGCITHVPPAGSEAQR